MSDSRRYCRIAYTKVKASMYSKGSFPGTYEQFLFGPSRRAGVAMSQCRTIPSEELVIMLGFIVRGRESWCLCYWQGFIGIILSDCLVEMIH